jgi:hypothetical protein
VDPGIEPKDRMEVHDVILVYVDYEFEKDIIIVEIAIDPWNL